jgi:ubiquinone/menaquinone biosynthesis C-methylase UbiE
MKYDETTIPTGYDRGRDHGPEVLALWMRAISSRVQGPRVTRALDLGCGTGRFSHALSTHFQCDVLGVDPSTRMLDQARAKDHGPRVQYQLGSGEELPVGAESVELIFMSMVFHHFTRPARVAEECRRVIRSRGLVFVRTGTFERIPAYPYVSFIAETVPLLERTLPPVAGIRRTFENAGFRLVDAGVIEQQIAPTYAAYADKLAAGADSILARLSQVELAAGLEAVRRHAETVDPTPVVEPIDFLAFTTSPPSFHA